MYKTQIYLLLGYSINDLISGILCNTTLKGNEINYFCDIVALTRKTICENQDPLNNGCHSCVAVKNAYKFHVENSK